MGAGGKREGEGVGGEEGRKGGLGVSDYFYKKSKSIFFSFFFFFWGGGGGGGWRGAGLE